ncbi:MAG: protein kinase [Acidobacteriota bacterium]
MSDRDITATIVFDQPHPPGASPPVLLAGEILAARFRIEYGLGQGGMGQIYAAFDLRLERTVALKVVRPELVLHPGVVERFKAEVRAAHRVTHHNVCRIFDLFEHRTDGAGPGLFFLTMELIRGRTLADRLRERSLSFAEGLPLLRQLARALDAAHRVGVVHGDIKPSNLMLADESGQERLVVTDFGLASARDGLDGVTGRLSAGTPAYMAPEQIAGAGASEHSDLFAFGLVAHEIITGRRVTGPPSFELLETSSWPARILRVVRACLDSDVTRRPRSAGHVLDALTAFDWRPAAGRVLPHRPHWRIERKLGVGGFGEAWLARHDKTGARHVLKFCYDAERLRALKREVTLFRLLRAELGERDDIARIIDWNLDTEPYYVETEFSPGGDLLAWAERQGGLRVVARSVWLDLVAQAAEALAGAHSIGVLHKDVKPANILIEEREDGPRVKLTDFGIGHVLERDRLEAAGITMLGLTATSIHGDAAGSRLYTAPEILEGHTPTVEADVYALGVMLYQMSVGDFSRVLADGWRRQVDDPLLADDIAAAVDGVARNRPGAAELARRLRTLEERRADGALKRRLRAEVEAQNEKLAEARRRRTQLSVVLAVAVVIVVVMGWLISRISDESSRARDAARIAVAIDQMDEDPTLAALALREIDDPDATARALMRQALTYPLARLEVRLPGSVRGVAIDHHGRRIAGTSLDGTIYLWDTGRPDRPQVLRGHQERVKALLFDHSGRYLITSALDLTIRVWDLETGIHWIALEDHHSRVWRLALDPRGESVVAPSEDHTAHIFKLNDIGETVVLRGHRHWVIDARFSPDGQRVVTASRDGDVRLWNRADGSLLDVFEGHESWVFHASFSPDGRYVVSASRDGTARIWDTRGERPPVVLSGHQGSVSWAHFREDGEQILTSAQDGTVRMWSVTGELTEVRVFGGGPKSAFYLPDGRHFFLASFGSVRVLPTDGSAASLDFADHREIATMAVSGDGRWLLGATGEAMRLWPLDTPLLGQVVTRLSAEILTMTLAPDGRSIAIGATDSVIRILEIDGVARNGFASDGFASDGFASDGAARYRGARYRVARERAALDGATWDRATRDRATRDRAAQDRTALGRATRERAARDRVALDGVAECQLTGHQSSVKALAFHPDGRSLASGSRDDTARLWSLGDNVFAELLADHGGTVGALAFRPDGSMLATGAFHGTVRLWRTDAEASAGKRILAVVPFSESLVSHLEFSPNGSRLLAVDSMGEVSVFEVTEGVSVQGDGEANLVPIATFEGQSLQCPSFARDGRSLVAIAGANRLVIFDLSSSSWPPPPAREWVFDDAITACPRFDAAGERVVVATASRVVRVLSVVGSQSPIELLGHTERVTSVLFLHDGSVLSGSLDRSIRVWRTDVPDPGAVIDEVIDICLAPEARRTFFFESAAKAEHGYRQCERQAGRAATVL